MRSKSLSRILSLSLCCAVVFLAGCSDTTPALTAVEVAVVYDLRDGEQAPRQELSVFVQSTVDTARIMELSVSHPATDIRWDLREPVVLSDGERVMAGSAHLMPPYFSPVPQGQYSITYTDLAGQVATGNFFLDYQDLDPIPLAQPLFPQREEGAEEPAEPTRRLAVFSEVDGGGRLLFFGKASDGWDEPSDVADSYQDAKSLRLCLDYPSRQVRYVLPPVNIESGE